MYRSLMKLKADIIQICHTIESLDIDVLVQEKKRNFIANALQLRLFCTNPSI